MSKNLYLSDRDYTPELDCDRNLIVQGEIVDIDAISNILAFGDVEINSEVQELLFEKEIPTVFFDKQANFIGRSDPNYSQRFNLTKAQALLLSQQKTYLAAQIVCAHLTSLFYALRRIQKSEKIQKTRELLRRDRIHIKRLYESDRITKIEQLRGLHGNALAKYYEVFNEAILTGFYSLESRQDKNDPVNQMLNFIYKLLEQIILTEIYAAGLDPYQGIFHNSYRDRYGLVSDFLQEFKIISDLIVIKTINHNQIVTKDWKDWHEEYLPPIVRGKLIATFEKKLATTSRFGKFSDSVSYRDAIAFQIASYAKYLAGEASGYDAIVVCQ